MIIVNLEKSKSIAHDIRRVARAAEFQPLDVLATIPSKATEAELARQSVRDKYALVQSDIDSATDVSVLSDIVKALK